MTRYRALILSAWVAAALLLFIVLANAAPTPTPSLPRPPATEQPAVKETMESLIKDCQTLTEGKAGAECKIVSDKDGNPTLSLDFANFATPWMSFGTDSNISLDFEIEEKKVE